MLEQQRDHELDGCALVRGAGRAAHFHATPSLVPQPGTGAPDALDAAPRETAFRWHVKELVLQGRAAHIAHQDLHASPLSAMIIGMPPRAFAVLTAHVWQQRHEALA
jgi:hypothetical protein